MNIYVYVSGKITDKYDELDKEIDKLLEDIPDIPKKETLLKLKQQIQFKLSGK